MDSVKMEIDSYALEEISFKGYAGGFFEEAIALQDGSVIDCYSERLVHHKESIVVRAGESVEEKRDYIVEYSDIGTYRQYYGERIFLYTKTMKFITSIPCDMETFKHILRYIKRKILPIDEYILEHFGPSGKLIKPKPDKYASMGQVHFYENYMRCDYYNDVIILPYRDVRVMTYDTQLNQKFSLIGKSPFGGATVIADKDWLVLKKRLQAIIKQVTKIVAKQNGTLAISVDGSGAIFDKKGFSNERTYIFSDMNTRASIVTLYDERLEWTYYSEQKGDVRAIEKLSVPYCEITEMETLSIPYKVVYGFTFEILLKAPGVYPETIKIATSTLGRKNFEFATMRLEEKLKKYAPNAKISHRREE